MFGQGIQPRGGFFTLSTGFSTGFVGRERNFPLTFHPFHRVFNTSAFQLCIRDVKSYFFCTPQSAPGGGIFAAGPQVSTLPEKPAILSAFRVFRFGIGPAPLFNTEGGGPPFFELWKTFPLFHIPFTGPGPPFSGGGAGV